MADTLQTQAPQLVTVSAKALDEIRKLLANQPEGYGLRLGIQGGGCSGFSYKLSFDAQQERDYTMTVENVTIFVDPKSAIYLKGIHLDYQGGLEGKGFVFQNPNAVSTCGCGESFSI